MYWVRATGAWLCLRGVRCEAGCGVLLAQLRAGEREQLGLVGLLMGFQGCCCFLWAAGQFSVPVRCLWSVVPAFKFT